MLHKADSNAVMAKVAGGRARASTIYAKKVEQKRLKRGLSKGVFAAHAEKDVVSLVKFLSDHKDDAGGLPPVSSAVELAARGKAEAAEVERHMTLQRHRSMAKTKERLEARTLAHRAHAGGTAAMAMNDFLHNLDQPAGAAPLPARRAGSAVAPLPNAMHPLQEEEEEDPIEAFLTGLAHDGHDVEQGGLSQPTTEPSSAESGENDEPGQDHASANAVLDFLGGLGEDEDDDDDDILAGYLADAKSRSGF